MSAIELSFVTENSLGSWFIRQGTHSDFSHVDIIMGDGTRVGARTDHPVPSYNPPPYRRSWEAGVQRRSANYAPFRHEMRVIIPVKRQERVSAAYSWLERQIGKPYDKSGLYASFLLNHPRKLPFRDEAAWWCSELACVFVEKAIGRMCATVANRMSPNDTFIFAGDFASVVYHHVPAGG